MYQERIKTLQAKLISDGLKSYIIKTSDPHLSEMVCDRFMYQRRYYCPFTGSSGTLLITQYKAYLFTDGRYWVQAAKELEGSEIDLVCEGKDGVENIYDFIKSHDLYPLGMDISLVSEVELDKFHCGDKKVYDADYSSLVPDMPLIPREMIWEVKKEYVSSTFEEKVKRILEEIKKDGATAIVISALDDIAHVLNYRGNDINCTPVFYSYLYLDTSGNIDLFIHKEKVPSNFLTKVKVHPYKDLLAFLKTKQKETFLLDPYRTNAKIYRSVKNKVRKLCPVYRLKAIKGEVEIKNTRLVQAYDGIKFVKLQKYIDDHIESAKLSEYDIAKYIDTLREKDSRCFSPAFESIVAIDANAAMMHYKPNKDNSKILDSKSQVVLVDSGGHYYGGTTDITRTFVVNKKPSKDVITDYTLTLKSHIALAKAIFEKGCTGQSLDYAARSIMWEKGLDYKCGTGHGVGYMLCVHEGPISFRYTSPLYGKGEALVPGHIITNEPGVYKEDKYGIRLENELLVRDAFVLSNEETKRKIQGTFYSFESISYVPFDVRGIDVNMLSDDEIEWLNKYHEKVYDILVKVTGSDKALKEYLHKITRPIER